MPEATTYEQRGPIGILTLNRPERLNALGDRLTRVAQLGDGEFDFNSPVGIGGHGPVRDMPLAVCDTTTVAPGDLVASDLIYPDRRGWFDSDCD